MSIPDKSFYFKYDPSDYRIKNDDGGFTTRNYYLEGEHLEAIYDKNFQLQDQYFRGVVVDEVVHGLHYDSEGNESGMTYHHDHLRSVTSLVESLGSAQATMQYGPFGNLIAETGNDNGNRLHYTGRELDDSGLYYYRNRYYDSEIGRFTTEDPKGFEAGVNFYTYVKNNPLSGNDPYGLDVIGINAGGGFVADFINDALGLKGAESTIIGFDTETLEFSVLTQSEIGVGKSTQSGSVGLFVNGVFVPGGVLDDLKGQGIQFSGSQELLKNKGVGVTFGVTSPINNFNPENPLIFEFGIQPFGRGGSEAGFTISTAKEQFRSSIIADTIQGAKNLLNDFSNFVTEGFRPPPSQANGGFVIYPNKPNTNMMQQVYSK